MGSAPLTMAADKLIGWFPCSSFTFNYEVSEETNSTLLADSENLEAQCAIFKAPLCYDGLDETVMYKWLSTESAFDGKFDPKYAASVKGGADSSTDSGSYKGGFITFIVVFIVATLAAAVFLFKWRRSKRHPGSATGEGTLPR
ncbi:hypothetical protein P43SY_006758 [Pythium insidiosum]|uniref:Uncharacterized protein n=1 Tax=Pythium insidiosum TaxID=114742 RepID=A0AAD5MIQ2_PYTIN|nr:hypothetical protein P43SY_006758 [Pythium insidiosum]